MYFIKLQFVFVVVLMALSYFLIDSLNEILQPATVTFYRCLFALIVVGVIILLQRKFYFTNVSWGKLLGFGLLYFLIPWLFIAYALQYLSIVSVVFLEAGVLLSINFFFTDADESEKTHTNEFIYFQLYYWFHIFACWAGKNIFMGCKRGFLCNHFNIEPSPCKTNLSYLFLCSFN